MAFNFGDKLEKDSGSTMIVDALNLAFRWKHQGRDDFRYEFQKTVKSLAQSYKCEKVLITADWGSSAFRKAISPEYKQNRKDKFEKQTEEEKLAFENFFEEFEAALEVMREDGYPVFRYKNVEADDIAAHIVKHKETYGIDKIWLISSDRDWDLLVQDGVSRFSYVTRKEVTVDNWDDSYDIEREKYISLKCLTGDSGDNVPGISGIGPKRAQQLLDTYGTAFDVYDAVPLKGTAKYIQSVNEQAEQILTNYELMDLITYCDEAIGKDNLKDLAENLA